MSTFQVKNNNFEIMNITAVIEFLDIFLTNAGRNCIAPVEANAVLDKAGLLRDSKDRPGKPLRDLLRKGLLTHAYQHGGKGSSWVIPQSQSGNTFTTNIYQSKMSASKNKTALPTSTKEIGKIENAAIKSNLENARQKYKPKKVKYLLVAEAPPDSLDRFFFFENVRQHDYLFLGIAQALYPELKEKFLSSGRSSGIKKMILEKFSKDGFYLLDLSELPLSLLNDNLESQLPNLLNKITHIADDKTKIILIKVNVYDIVFTRLSVANIANVIDARISFPGKGGQRRFQVEFRRALVLVGFFKINNLI